MLIYQLGLGSPVVTLGITIGRIFPIVGILTVIFLTSAVMVLSVKIIKQKANIWLTGAHLLAIVTMSLAIYYAFGVSFSITTISIASMITTHGILNGLGFVPMAIQGWHNLIYQTAISKPPE